jgi:hypothetical protein
MQQPDLFEEARARRDLGIERAATHANQVVAAWVDMAVDSLRVYSRTHEEFLTEDVREIAYALGLPQPPDGRAWGQVMRRGQREGVVERCGYAPAHSSNCSPKVKWRSRMMRGAR